MLLRPLYESWLLRSTTAPLAPWQRHLLLKALERDEQLRCLAMELAQFSQHDEAPADLHAPDLRARLRNLVDEPPALPRAWRPGWATAGALLALLAGGLGWWWLEPAQQRVELARVEQAQEAADLRLPSATPTHTLTATPAPTAVPSETASVSDTAAVAASPTAKP